MRMLLFLAGLRFLFCSSVLLRIQYLDLFISETRCKNCSKRERGLDLVGGRRRIERGGGECRRTGCLSHLLLHLSGRPGWFRKVKTWTTSPLALRPTCRPGQLASRWRRRPGSTWTAPSGTRPPSQVWENCNFDPI